MRVLAILSMTSGLTWLIAPALLLGGSSQLDAGQWPLVGLPLSFLLVAFVAFWTCRSTSGLLGRVGALWLLLAAITSVFLWPWAAPWFEILYAAVLASVAMLLWLVLPLVASIYVRDARRGTGFQDTA